MGLGEHRLRALARLAAEGLPVRDIADNLYISEALVRRYLDVLKFHRNPDPYVDMNTGEVVGPTELTEREERFLKHVDNYEEQVATAAALHRWRLTDFLDDAYTAVKTALNDGSAQVRSATAWRTFEEIFGVTPGRGGTPAQQPSVQVNLQLNQEVVKAAGMLSGVQQQLEALGTTTYSTHLREVGAGTGQPFTDSVGSPK